jgi:hypothetical protein
MPLDPGFVGFFKTRDIGFILERQIDIIQSTDQLFLVAGFNDQATHALMNTMCPGTLFPYARQTISSLIADGGFPPLTLQPVNFEHLYAQRMQQMMAGNANDSGGAMTEETVAAEFPSEH